MATAKSEIQLVVTAKDDASSTLKRVGSSMESIGKIGKVIAGGLALAGAGAVAFGVSAVKSFNDSEKELAQLNSVLKSTNGIAGVTQKKALDLASAFQKTTTYSDEAVLSAENMLLTFTNIKDNVFPDATQTVLDMSTALGQDTKNSAIQLGKALNDPILGVTALRRVGVAFTEDQQKQIETLVKSGKTMDAQKLILKELATEFGGSAQAQAQTFAGKIEILKNQFDDLKESVGKVIVDAITPFIGSLATAIENIPTVFNQATDSVKTFFGETSTSGVWIRDNLMPIFQNLRDVVVQSWGEILKAIEPIRPELEWFVKIIGSALLGAIVAVIIVAVKLIETLVKGASIIITAFSNAVQILRNLFSALFSWILKDNNSAIDSLKKAWEGLKNFFPAIFSGIGGVITNAVKPAIDLINKIIARYNDLPGTPNIPEIRLGGKQFGGGVNAGSAYVVGEKRPEVFVPSQSGNIKQMGQASGGNIEVTFNNVNVRNDNDLDYIIRTVRETLGRDQSLASFGIRTY